MHVFAIVVQRYNFSSLKKTLKDEFGTDKSIYIQNNKKLESQFYICLYGMYINVPKRKLEKKQHRKSLEASEKLYHTSMMDCSTRSL